MGNNQFFIIPEYVVFGKGHKKFKKIMFFLLDK